jgi:hypothetical protein
LEGLHSPPQSGRKLKKRENNCFLKIYFDSLILKITFSGRTSLPRVPKWNSNHLWWAEATCRTLDMLEQRQTDFIQSKKVIVCTGIRRREEGRKERKRERRGGEGEKGGEGAVRLFWRIFGRKTAEIFPSF